MDVEGFFKRNAPLFVTKMWFYYDQGPRDGLLTLTLTEDCMTLWNA